MKLSVVLPTVYLAIAVLAWIDFSRLPPDGLANLGLMFVVFPVTLLDLFLRPSSAPGASVLMPDDFGYYFNHAIYFVGGVLCTGTALAWVGSLLDQRCGRKPGDF